MTFCDDFETFTDSDVCLVFWSVNRRKLNVISIPTSSKTISIPATVLRVFNKGGINRASMSDKTLADLVFLKCNDLYKNK
jgi:hypothetical protein